MKQEWANAIVEVISITCIDVYLGDNIEFIERDPRSDSESQCRSEKKLNENVNKIIYFFAKTLENWINYLIDCL